MLHPLHSFAKDHPPCPSDNLLVMFIVSLALRVKDEQILVFFFFLMVSFKKENSYLEVEIAFPLNLIKRQREREREQANNETWKQKSGVRMCADHMMKEGGSEGAK